MTLLTADDVLKKTFQTTKFREGYDQDEVDDFLDEIVNTLRVLQGENAELKAKIAEQEQAGGEATRAAAADQTSQITPVVDEPVAEPEAEVTPEPEPEPVVEAAPVEETPVTASAPAVQQTSVVPAGQTEPESATGMLQLAQRVHDEYVRNGRDEGDRIVGAARQEAATLVSDAEAQRARTLQQLETERATLEHKIEGLKEYERDYRGRLKTYIGSLLETLDAQADQVSLDGPPARL
ncbi:DivIVA domain-containing protein [Litorihabitans aurantiacus]|uniref:Cell wall synthesis protein Wag31 n=1 Tax=Litorihabitans aurantiacus TaxID=1930061 RepID=A0AA37XEJ5_9MICO|nr:DivIVA domain-containing protein [Litorihabitans aurantiacus]GMA31709.1 cell division protein DivIVA [Litorihabitans aurantiacus]